MNVQLPSTIRSQSSPHAMSGLAPDAGEYLAFRVAGEQYAIDILCIQEIRSFEPPTRIANAPPSVLGIINLRGTMVPIVDLRKHLKSERFSHDAFTVVIVAALRDRLVGLVVDAVSGVVNLEADNLHPAPEFCAVAGPCAIQHIGVLPRPEGAQMLVLLDVLALMQSAELALEPEAAYAFPAS